MSKQIPLDFKLIEKPLDTLLAALANKIEREWPPRLSRVKGARELFLILVRVSDVTYKTVRYICADKPRDPFRRVEYSISVPPLNRTLLDSIFTTIFLLEDLPKRCEWYFKAGWREENLELQRHIFEYGSLPEWQDWLAEFAAHCRSGIIELGIPPQAVSNPEQIVRWPNPGQMVSYGVKQQEVPLPENRLFLRYLNDWFYRDLSSQSHLGGLGLMKRGGFLLNYSIHDTQAEARLHKFKHNQVGVTLTLILALASEIEAHCGFGLVGRIQYLWTVLLNSIPLSEEIYEKRYSTLLRSSAA